MRTSGERAISLNAVASLATTGWGSDLGAAMAFQISRLKFCTPASAKLGISGTSGLRPLDVTPIARSLPALIWALASAGGSIDSCNSPAIIALATCG